MSNKNQYGLDRKLDDALAKYATAEPRPGLEDRVLANLRAERTRVRVHAWWRWGVSVMLAVAVVALALIWRSGKPPHQVVTNHPAVATGALSQPATQITSNRGGSGILPLERRAVRKMATHLPYPPIPIAAQPKLNQFPSPMPLNEQERILAIYVAQYPERAVLIARARSEELRQDQIEEMKTFRSDAPASDSEEGNSDSSER